MAGSSVNQVKSDTRLSCGVKLLQTIQNAATCRHRFIMERIDLVIVGAEGVVESGGIINKVGTRHGAAAARHPHLVAVYLFLF